MLASTNEIEDILEDAIRESENDMDKASYWSDIQYKVMYMKDDFKYLKKCLDIWIGSIDISNYLSCDDIEFECNALFLTFNYTETLQKLYKISNKQIRHIHSKRVGEKILGHNQVCSRIPIKIWTEEDFDNGVEGDWRIEEAKEIVNTIPKELYKDSKSLININQDFFRKINSCDQIVFLGWSLGEQDKIYIEEILSKASLIEKIIVVYYKLDTEVVGRYEQYLERYKDEDVDIVFYT